MSEIPSVPNPPADRLIAAAAGHGMVSEMDGLPEIAVLVMGLHARAERAEAALEQARALAAEAFPLNVVVLGDPDNQDLRNRVRAFLLSAEGGAA